MGDNFFEDEEEELRIAILEDQEDEAIRKRKRALRRLWAAELQHEHNLLHKPWQPSLDEPEDIADPFAGDVVPWFTSTSMDGRSHYILEEISKYVKSRLAPAELDKFLLLRQKEDFLNRDSHFPGYKHVSTDLAWL